MLDSSVKIVTVLLNGLTGCEMRHGLAPPPTAFRRTLVHIRGFLLQLAGCDGKVTHIQGVPGGMCQTSGGCSLC